MNDLVIRTEGLSKRYGKISAVDGLSMEVLRGHVYGLLGPNGSGKTTTMGMLLGLVRPTSGSFSLFGSTGRHEDALRRVGAIVETPSFYPYLSGRRNLAYFQGISGRGSPSEIDALLDRVSLLARADSRFQTYSLGMKQRLGIAYALLGDPELLFLDEPTNGMDPEGMAEIRDLILSLGTDGRTVLLSSHLLNEVEQVCDSVTILSKGRLIAQGEVAELIQSRGREQIRASTTDDARAVEILTALDWVEDVTPKDGSLMVAAPHERLLGADGRPEPRRCLCLRALASSDLPRGVFPGGNGRRRGRRRDRMIAQVLRLTVWEWFKLRRRWQPWILLAVAVVLAQIGLWVSYAAYHNEGLQGLMSARDQLSRHELRARRRDQIRVNDVHRDCEWTNT